MTTARAINEAMKIFQKEHKTGDIRKVVLLEGSGDNRKWKDLLIGIEYAIDGDYAESDAHPFEVKIYDNDGKITGERI